MFFLLAKYKRYFIITLVLLLLIPCTLKRELKQVALFEKEQQSTPGQFKISCAPFYQLNLTDIKENVKKQILTPIVFSSLDTKHFSAIAKTILPDFFIYQKEKIPSYLLFEQFLI